jgi:DNA-binding transcriptional MocR family regulator
MILLSIDQTRGVPVYRQIVNGIVAHIEAGTLTVGERLPSTRRLCDRLGVNRTTVYRAYEELTALGYIESRPGSYTTVRQRTRIAPLEDTAKRPLISWNRVSVTRSRRLFEEYADHFPEYEKAGSPGVIDLSRLYIEERLFPLKDFRRCLNEVLSDGGQALFAYGNVAGHGPLRETVAHRLKSHGISVAPDNILITHGAQQALDLVLRLLLEPGARVVVESPTYSHIIPLLRYYGSTIVEVPMRVDGMDLCALERALRKEPPALVYTMPNFHNPTGITTPQAHRERLLALCERFRTPIIEDGFEEELKYFGKSVLPIKSMDRRQIVVYVGTFSKVLFPGLRIGWIAADRECIRRLCVLKRFIDISENIALQAAMVHFYREGFYDRHVRRVHTAYRQKMNAALKAMKRFFPAGVTWTTPEGGYTIWVTLRRPYRPPGRLDELMRKHRVLVSPGDHFFYGSSPTRHFRVSIAHSSEQEIKEGVIRLGRLLGELRGSRG